MARDWINAGRKISAADALSSGLVTHVCRFEEQESLITELLQAQCLSRYTQQQIYRVTALDEGHQAADLQSLILSIMPGSIKQRISEYINQ